MARPTYKIDQKALRYYREKSNLTQYELAKKVREILEINDKKTSPATIQNFYQRIETSGSTSKKTAEALAEALEIPLDSILNTDQFDKRINFIDKLKIQLQQQLKDEKNNVLKKLFKLKKSNEQTKNDDQVLVDVVEEVAKRIEYSQFGEDQSELESLVAITGWSQKQLQEQTVNEGYWFLKSTSQNNYGSQILLGITNVLSRVQRGVSDDSKQLPNFDTDTRIRFERSKHWIHIKTERSKYKHLNSTYSFARCKPNQEGMRWVKPSWLDELFIERQEEFAFEAANFITDFDGNDYPKELKNLGLKIVETTVRNTSDGLKASDRIAYTKGNLDKLSPSLFQEYENEGRAHYCVTNHLITGLVSLLFPYINQYENLIHDGFSTKRNKICISIIPALKQVIREPSKNIVEIKYVITLVEEVPEGGFREAPWNVRDCNEAVETLNKQIMKQPLDVNEGLVFSDCNELSEKEKK